MNTDGLNVEFISLDERIVVYRADKNRSMLFYMTTRFQFPVATLTELLAFDNDQDTMDFVTDFGIVPSPEDPSCIVLSKDIYYEKPPLYVSQWINDKNALTLLEVLDGAVTTPNYEEPQEVTESFDCQGRYVNDPVLLEAILKLKVEVNHQKPTFPNSALRRIPELRKEPAKTIREEQKLTSLFSPSPVTPKPQTFGSFNFNSTTSKLPFASFKPKDIASVPAKQPQSFRFAFKPKEAAPSVPQLTPVAPKASPPKLRRPEEPKPEEFRRLSSIEEPHPVEERESSPEVLSSAERRDQEAQQEAFLGSMAGDMATKLCNHVAAVLFGKMATRIFEEEQEAERLNKEMDKIADRIQILRIAERVRRYGKLWKKKWMDARRPHIEDLPQIMPRISVNFNSTNMNYDLPWQDSRRFRRGSLIGHADADISFGRVFARIFKEERKVEVDEEELKEIAARILRTRINERVKRYALLWKKKWKDAQKAHVENLSQIMSRIPLNFPESIGMNFRLPMLERNLSCVLTPRPRREQPICETPLARPMPDRTTFSDSIRPTEAKRRRTSTEAS
ncbi:hypothetical protein L596_026032 [Steinernema carpocapsae]|uniref:Uncharacterized protein n=1 Tax=Steinernema carpocapsae TaxID=34508 RepID=A0A4U5M096_STECR|nr:hypothetical protein L596_026032 [Steinernema carpocapsae]